MLIKTYFISMSPDKFTCSNCNFSSSFFSSWGTFSYKKGNRTVPIDRQIGICYDCEAIAPVEKLPTQQDLRITKQMSDFEKPIRDAEDRLQLLSDRESEARCLKCGGHNFTIIPNDYSYSRNFKSGKTIPTGVTHKGCGGDIMAEKSPITDIFMGDHMPKRFYTVEGIEI